MRDRLKQRETTSAPTSHPRSAVPRLTWTGNPDLLGIQFTLRPSVVTELPSNYTYWLHAWFLGQMQDLSAELSAELHDNQTEKAFTLSSFLGSPLTVQAPDRPQNQTLTFSPQETYQLQITALSAPVCKALKQWLTQPPSQIKLQKGIFQILDRQISLSPTTYDQLWEDAKPNHPLILTFLTPTSFHKQGNHMPLPIPENLFHSYLRRWNIFANWEFEQQDFLDWVNQCVVLLRHEIRSRKVQVGKDGSVTGFIGSIQLGLTNQAKQEPEYVQLIHALINSAPYFSTGHKTTFGLGQTRLGWMTPAVVAEVRSLPTPAAAQALPKTPTATNKGVAAASPAAASPMVAELRSQLIQARIAELEPQFIATRKRQGGDRAKLIARQWAKIIAHQEAGDSLKTIAAEMKIPYETVKKYAQLARKQMT
ncbi:MAG: CRISPR-associated endoribonuclease Cas6 [Synechococcales bacterium]|nr:CRISPR-associated endoribonuclease Cas6 [Synechococcales bacterium]